MKWSGPPRVRIRRNRASFRCLCVRLIIILPFIALKTTSPKPTGGTCECSRIVLDCDEARSSPLFLFQRVPLTSIPEQSDEESDDALSKIGQYFPPSTLGLFFPPLDRVPTVAEVIQYMNLQAAPVSLYVVSGNDLAANRNLQHLFQRYPVRILCLQSTDFCSLQQLPSVTTHDVAVAAFGASDYPALMVECSDCFTFLTVPEPGRFASHCMHEGIVSQMQRTFPDVEDVMKLLDDEFLQRSVVDDNVLKQVLHSFLLVVKTTMETFVQLYTPRSI